MKLVRFLFRLFVAQAPTGQQEWRHPSPAPPAVEPRLLPAARVIHVIDGDTICVAGIHGEFRIRLAAIDCPEDGQPWGIPARNALIQWIGGRIVQLEVHNIDRHGRTVATIYIESRTGYTNVNERLVMCGHAWAARAYYGQLPRCRQRKLNQLERWARSKRVGLWKAENPVPPWRWRAG